FAERALAGDIAGLGEIDPLVGAAEHLERAVEDERVAELLGLFRPRRERHLRFQPSRELRLLAEQALQRDDVDAREPRLAGDLPQLRPVGADAAVDRAAIELSLQRDQRRLRSLG